MAFLEWIDDEKLIEATRKVFNSFKQKLKKQTLAQLEQNVIDPFTLLFETTLRADLPIDEWIQAEAQRQAQKTLTNAVGGFHQTILGGCNGWQDLKTSHETGLDLMRENPSLIFAEVKNKHNTITGTHLNNIFSKMKNTAEKYPVSKVYLVHVVTKHNYGDDGMVWKLTVKGELLTHPRVRLIGGKEFYALVTGRKNAMYELYLRLPDVIKFVIQDDLLTNQSIRQSIQAIDQLQALTTESDNPTKAIYNYFFNVLGKNVTQSGELEVTDESKI